MKTKKIVINKVKLIIFVISILSIFFVYNEVRINNMTKTISILQKEKKVLIAAKDQKIKQLFNQIEDEEIIEIAKTQLDMDFPTKDQIKKIDNISAKKIKEESINSTIIDKVSDNLLAVFKY